MTSSESALTHRLGRTCALVTTVTTRTRRPKVQSHETRHKHISSYLILNALKKLPGQGFRAKAQNSRRTSSISSVDQQLVQKTRKPAFEFVEQLGSQNNSYARFWTVNQPEPVLRLYHNILSYRQEPKLARPFQRFGTTYTNTQKGSDLVFQQA